MAAHEGDPKGKDPSTLPYSRAIPAGTEGEDVGVPEDQSFGLSGGLAILRWRVSMGCIDEWTLSEALVPSGRANPPAARMLIGVAPLENWN